MLGELLALFTAVLWALTPVFGKKALEESSIVALNFVRSVFGSMALWLILPVARGWRLVDVDPYSLALLTAAAVIGMGLGDLAFFKSMDMIGVSRSTAISSTYPLFTTFISILLLGEKLTVLNFLGTVSVVLGVSLIS
ncbi:DMT family transporter, partial [Candidatus Bathyarchaeota archaeon]|nr:DMT family transporter [Candidatus Bathyarchaeota archaeon]